MYKYFNKKSILFINQENNKYIAVDCEFATGIFKDKNSSFTYRGNTVISISIVDYEGKILLDKLIKP